jgi:hypothetical protein
LRELIEVAFARRRRLTPPTADEASQANAIGQPSWASVRPNLEDPMEDEALQQARDSVQEPIF